MAQNKQKGQAKQKTFVEKCANWMWVLIVPQAIIAIIIGIFAASAKKSEDDKKPVVEEVKATVSEITISAVPSDDVSTTRPPSATSYKVEFKYKNQTILNTIQLPSSKPLNIGDTLTLYIVNNNVNNVFVNKPEPSPPFSNILIFIASAFAISAVIGLAIKMIFPTFACFIVVINVLVILLSILKGAKVF